MGTLERVVDGVHLTSITHPVQSCHPDLLRMLHFGLPQIKLILSFSSDFFVFDQDLPWRT